MRNRRFVATVAGFCTLGLMAGIGVTAAFAAASPKAKYEINLNGANEPGGGDADGIGISKILVKSKDNTVCVGTKKVLNVPLPSQGHHIHAGDSQTNGPVVVPLTEVIAKASKPGKPAKPGKSAKLCGTTSAENILSMINTPSQWYVNVHSSEFPGGAIRAQLG